MKLIDKSDIIAEIEKRIKEIDEIGTYLSPKGVLTNLLCHLNTLETKEVDFDKKQIKSLHDLLKYNIGVFDYQKFMDVQSLYDDLTKIFNDKTD